MDTAIAGEYYQYSASDVISQFEVDYTIIIAESASVVLMKARPFYNAKIQIYQKNARNR